MSELGEANVMLLNRRELERAFATWTGVTERDVLES